VTTRISPRNEQDLLERTVAARSLDGARAWALLRGLARRASAGRALTRTTGLELDEQGELVEVAAGRGLVTIRAGSVPSVEHAVDAEPEALELLELYLPLCVGAASEMLVVGHLGQSLDGQIATSSGASQYVTGPENIRHLHRLRALFDAVIVGANTVECDNPQLTTRLVSGPNPTRVVLDPNRRLHGTQALFKDGVAPTLVLCAHGSEKRNGFTHAEVLGVDGTGELLPVANVIESLRTRGLNRLFVEGGGVTVSRFLEARALHRLHLTVSSVFLGEGRPGVKLPGISDLDHALRPKVRRFTLGDDVLFDCDFDAS
jgi:diaminohydroxyphosphoribosylaminopyrimidine deaminase / 5-amino-6-(5-phosphoribosylamino)uracil reductase